MVKGKIWEDALSSFRQEERPHSFRANGALRLLAGQWKQNFNCFETGGFKSKDRKRIEMIFHLLPLGVVIQFVTVTLGGEQKNINSFRLSELYKMCPLKVWECLKGWDALCCAVFMTGDFISSFCTEFIPAGWMSATFIFLTSSSSISSPSSLWCTAGNLVSKKASKSPMIL